MSSITGPKDNFDNWTKGDKPIPHQERVKYYLKASHFSRDPNVSTEAPISVKEFVHIVQRHQISMQAGWKKSKGAFKRALETLLKEAGIPKNNEIRTATKKLVPPTGLEAVNTNPKLPPELVGLITGYAAEANERPANFMDSVNFTDKVGLYLDEDDRADWSPVAWRSLREVEAELNEKMMNELLEYFAPGQNKKAVVDELQKTIKARLAVFELERKCQKCNHGIEKALKQREENGDFIFPKALKEIARDVSYVQLSHIGKPFVTAQALQEILKYMPHIDYLNVRGSPLSEEMVDVILQFKNLTYLNVAFTKMNDALLKRLAPGCTKLKILHISWNNDITDLQPLSSCTALEYLYLCHCEKVTNVQPLASCTELNVLDIVGCEGITNLEPLLSCPKLKKVLGGRLPPGPPVK